MARHCGYSYPLVSISTKPNLRDKLSGPGRLPPPVLHALHMRFVVFQHRYRRHLPDPDIDVPACATMQDRKIGLHSQQYGDGVRLPVIERMKRMDTPTPIRTMQASTQATALSSVSAWTPTVTVYSRCHRQNGSPGTNESGHWRVRIVCARKTS